MFPLRYDEDKADQAKENDQGSVSVLDQLSRARAIRIQLIVGARRQVPTHRVVLLLQFVDGVESYVLTHVLCSLFLVRLPTTLGVVGYITPESHIPKVNIRDEGEIVDTRLVPYPLLQLLEVFRAQENV
jgi:hypothetical protein